MDKYNAKNERIKREYFEYQKEARKKSDSTVDHIRKAIDRYEEYTSYKDFKIFNIKIAIAFKKFLSQSKAVASNKFLSKSEVVAENRTMC